MLICCVLVSPDVNCYDGVTVINQLFEEICRPTISSSGADALEMLRLRCKELKYIIIENDGSGNCMFSAISDQLQYRKSAQLSISELRGMGVLALQENPTLVKNTLAN